MSLSSLLIYMDHKYKRQRIGIFLGKLRIYEENNAKGFVRLPSGIRLLEAKIRVLEVGPLHNVLEKGWSEPCWARKLQTTLNENSPEVKNIPLRHLSDNVSLILRGESVIPGLTGRWLAKQIVNTKFTGSVSDPMERLVMAILRCLYFHTVPKGASHMPNYRRLLGRSSYFS